MNSRIIAAKPDIRAKEIIYYKIMSSPGRDQNTQVFIGKLPWRVQERDLEKEFQRFGDIKGINIKKGYAFIVIIYPRTHMQEIRGL